MMKRGLILILITLLAVPFVFASPNGCSPVTGDLNDDFLLTIQDFQIASNMALARQLYSVCADLVPDALINIYDLQRLLTLIKQFQAATLNNYPFDFITQNNFN